MTKYRVAVCKGPDCKAGGSDAVFRALKTALEQAGASVQCEAYRGGCYGLCHLGPNMVVRPDTGVRDPFSREDYQLMGWPGETHYGAMTPAKLGRIIDEHLKQGRPVEEYRAAEVVDDG